MQYTIGPVREDDGKAIVDIFNHYVENSFSAYPEEKVPYQFFQILWKLAEGYPFLAARDDCSAVMGFALLRQHNPLPVFSRAAEVSCFIAPEHREKGIGSALYDGLFCEGHNKGIATILAGISSLNPDSLAFHRGQGFVECGRFLEIGRKWGQDFDVVWMQKMI